MKNKKFTFRYTFSILFSLLCSIAVWGQDSKVVTGSVTSQEDGEPLLGATVLLRGTTVGTVTDIDGTFSIEVPMQGSVLEISYTGYLTTEVTVGDASNLDVILQQNVEQLSEVVVIGYGERTKRDLTGSISSVSSKELEKLPFSSPEFALQGNSPGVRVVNASGDPSASPQIFIRGIGTWNGAAQPLYVIDGQIISPPTATNQDLIGDINLWTLINPNDIESISVLKDASAGAIYGSRAANGVILITTKKGKKGKPSVELSVQTGISNVPTYDVLKTQQFLELGQELYTNSTNPDITIEQDLYGRDEADENTRLNNFSPQYDPSSPYYLGNANTYDWQKEAINENALSQNYNVKVSGASDAASYFVSLGYTDQESTIKGDDLTRYNLTSNVSADITKFLSAGVTYRASYQIAKNEGNIDLVGAAVVPPWQPIYDPNDEYGYHIPFTYPGEGWNQTRKYGRGTRSNVFASQLLSDSKFEQIRSVGQGWVELKPFSFLTLRGGLSLDYINQERTNFGNIEANKYNINSADPATVGNGSSYGSLGHRINEFINYQADFTATIAHEFGDHSINVVGGIQDQYYKRFNQDLSTNSLSTNDYERLFIPNSAEYTVAFSGRDQKFWYSYFTRGSYNYQYKYYLDLSFRRDASSGFPEDKRWGNFYSIAGAWRISSEPFMQGLSFINDLKIRGGWGQSGNDEAVVGAYAYLSTVAEKGSYRLGSGNGDPVGNYNVAVALDDLPNRDLTWETVTSTTIGFDAILMNNRVNATVEYFNRKTEDILQFINLPPSVGVNDPAANIGSMRNSGLELLLGYNGGAPGGLTYNVTGNITFLKNEVLELYNDQPLSGSVFGRVEEGRSVGHIWGYELGGIFQTQAEIDAYYSQNPDETIADASYVGPGDMYFLDVQGNPTEEEPFYSKTPDGVINAFDQTEIGQTIPGYTYGISFSIGYGNFDLNANFYGEGDVQKMNTARMTLENLSGAGTNRITTVLDRWTPSNSNTSLPRAVNGDPAGNDRFSTRWLEDASFFRLNNWQLGYSLPESLMARMDVFSRFRLFIGGQNNIYLKKWSTLDPINDNYPLSRTYFLGLNVNF